MVRERMQRGTGRIGSGIFGLVLLMVLMGAASAAWGRYALPADRSIAWKGNVGVRKGIPCRNIVHATLSPSGSDDTALIQGALDACPVGRVVLLRQGTFTVSRPITVGSYVTLRGAGMGETIIRGREGMTGSYVVGITGRSQSFGRAFRIASGLAKGSASITTSSPHGWSPGDVILIDQLNDPEGDPPVTNKGSNPGTCTWCGRLRGTRSLGQVNRVVATPSSRSAVLEIPLYWEYDPALSPEAVKMNGMAVKAGIENLTVDNTLSGSSAQASDGGTILFKSTADCWLFNVEAVGAWETMVRMHGTYRNTVRSCTLHEGVSPSGSSQYGIFMNPYNSGNLVENNRIYRLTSGILFNGAVSGNVFAYNWITDLSSGKSPGWNMAAIGTHGSHPMMNLIEGNYAEARMRNDDVWGSSSHNTLFRNRVHLPHDKGSGAWDIDLHSNQQYYNVVGNVLGRGGSGYSYELSDRKSSARKSVFRLGYGSDGDSSPQGNDARVQATVLRHGNWDSATQGPVWNGSDDRTLPASLYLSRKPRWWGAMKWPCIGPDVRPLFPSPSTVGKRTPWGKKNDTGEQCVRDRKGRR